MAATNVRVDGDNGKDTIEGDPGQHELYGGNAKDQLNQGPGFDLLDGGERKRTPATAGRGTTKLAQLVNVNMLSRVRLPPTRPRRRNRQPSSIAAGTITQRPQGGPQDDQEPLGSVFLRIAQCLLP